MIEARVITPLAVRPLVGRRAYWRQWAAARWFPLAGLTVVLPIFLLSAFGSLAWPGRTFPGFFVLRNGVIPTVGLSSWTGMEAGLPFHGRVVAIDGRPLIDAADVYRVAGSRPPGTPIAYTVEKQGERRDYRVPTMRFGMLDYGLSLGLMLVFGLVASGLSVAVGLIQPSSEVTRAFVVQGIVTALFGLTGPMLYLPSLWWTSPLHLATQAAVPAALVHLGLRFPDVLPLVRRRSPWRFVPWVATLLLLPWMVAEFDRNPPRTDALYLSYYYTVLAIVVLVGLVLRGLWTDRLPRTRRQRQVLIPGLVLGLSASFFGFLDIARHGGSFPIQLISPFPAIFYLSVAWAIARYDLFEIDRALKRLAVYALLTVGIAAGYAGVTAAASVVGGVLDADLSRVATVAFFLVVAMVFEPVRARVQAVADRMFASGRPDHAATVDLVSSGLTALLDPIDILTLVGRTLEDAFAPSDIRALLWADGRLRHARLGLHAPTPAADDAPEWARLRRLLEGASREVLEVDGLTSLAGADDPMRPPLAVPMRLHDRAVGAFVVGPRRSGRRYRARDGRLLTTLAAQAAIALENARSHHALQLANLELEERVRARTRELEQALAERETLQVQVIQQEKMASLGILVAGVAHEINNPVSFIVGTVPPLRAAFERLDGQHADEDTRRLLAGVQQMIEVIADGASRTARIVQDLRLFSRVGEIELRPMDVVDAIEVVLRLTHPRWRDRIAVERDFEPVPMIVASPEQISQVLMNLVTNAADAIPDRGTIRVTTRSEHDHVVITVRDDGPGIPSELLPRIFDPFFSTKPTGKGTGLGLTISAGIVERHGGRLEVISSPGSGTEFRLVMPVRGMVERAAS